MLFGRILRLFCGIPCEKSKALEARRRDGPPLRDFRWRLYKEARADRLPGVVRIGKKSLRFDWSQLTEFIRVGGRRPAA